MEGRTMHLLLTALIIVVDISVTHNPGCVGKITITANSSSHKNYPLRLDYTPRCWDDEHFSINSLKSSTIKISYTLRQDEQDLRNILLKSRLPSYDVVNLALTWNPNGTNAYGYLPDKWTTHEPWSLIHTTAVLTSQGGTVGADSSFIAMYVDHNTICLPSNRGDWSVGGYRMSMQEYRCDAAHEYIGFYITTPPSSASDKGLGVAVILLSSLLLRL